MHVVLEASSRGSVDGGARAEIGKKIGREFFPDPIAFLRSFAPHRYQYHINIFNQHL